MKKKIYLVVLKPTSHRTAEESLGIEYLASVLIKEGYEAKIRDTWIDNSINEEIVFHEIIQEKNDVLFVGVSSYMLNNDASCQLINKLNQNNINTVAGGYGPTFEPEKFLKSGAKLVMFGEGEKTIIDVAHYFEQENAQNENLKRSCIFR